MFNQMIPSSLRLYTLIILALCIFAFLIIVGESITEKFQQPSSKQISQITKQSSSDISELNSDDWGEYHNELGQYSIQYPSNWSFSEEWSEQGGVVFFLRNPEKNQRDIKIGISMVHAPKDLKISQVLTSKQALLSESGKVSDAHIKELTIDSVNAYELLNTQTPIDTLETILLHNERIYTLWITPYDPSHPQFGEWFNDSSLVYHSMVSTFRFSN